MYDYVIVGGGSAGCVLAARLSEDPDIRVLLLEAGPPDKDWMIHLPVGFYKMTGGGLTWGFKTAPQAHCLGREIPFAQARVLGGGSSINAEVFTRGCPQDYDRWAQDEGCPGWSFREVQPLFLRMEDNDTLAGAWHGTGGPLGVSTPDPHPMTRLFVQACQQLGMPYSADFNAGQQAGAGVYQTTTRGARRCSAAVGYLAPARGRRNLEVVTEARTTRIIVEHGRAVGVRYRRGAGEATARAEREVLLCAGAIGSPKLLMLSGIGPAEHLRGHGIDVVHDLPGVGENLHDHYGTDIVYALNGPWSLDKYQRWHWAAWAGLQYLLFKRGPVASTIVEGGAFWWSDRSSPIPDTQFHFLAGAGVEEGVPRPASGAGVTLNSYVTRPRSRGTLRLRDARPDSAPIIDPNYLSDPHDLRLSVEAVKTMREIMHQPVWAKVVEKEHLPGEACRSDAEIAAYVRRQGRTCYHPVGACRMGSDERAVVDPALRVRGIEALRVCDSSIMPSLVSSNTNAPTLMIAEKASDLIRGNRIAAAA